jgi:hypothetical protein
MCIPIRMKIGEEFRFAMGIFHGLFARMYVILQAG